jgi:FixJ family two-component response regulator
VRTEPLKIAVIDDDVSCREAIAGFVAALGYQTLTFASATRFLAGDQPRDLLCLILDVKMPGMTGLELQARLAAAGDGVPIIFVTSLPDTLMRARALAAGALGLLSKPFDRDELERHIHEAGRRRLELFSLQNPGPNGVELN